MPRHEDVCTELFNIFGRAQQISWYGTVPQEVRAPPQEGSRQFSGFRDPPLYGPYEFESQNYSLPLFISTTLFFLESQKIFIFLQRLYLSQCLRSLSLLCLLGGGLRNPPVRWGLRDLSLGVGMEPSN